MIKDIKKSLYIALILFTVSFISCKKNDTKIDKLDTKFIQDYKFSDWLRKHNLEVRMFSDSSKISAFELWHHTSGLTKSDSISLREPSSDSSYILISNFDKKTLPEKNLDYYTFGFLPKGQHNYFIGIGIKNEYSKEKIIDYFWINDNTFALLTSEIESESSIYNVMKLKIKVDSI